MNWVKNLQMLLPTLKYVTSVTASKLEVCAKLRQAGRWQDRMLVYMLHGSGN